MVTRIVKTEEQRALLLRYLTEAKLPFTATVVKGRNRSVDQNRLQRRLINEIAEQLGDRTAEEVRGYCKLVGGVPILRAENEEFRERYDAVVRPLPYETKLAIMQEPLDLPVTRLMTVDQATRYLEWIYRHFSEQGIALAEAA